MSEIKCPKCGSTQIHADKKGFSGKQAVAGAVLAGPIGAAAGTINSNKIRVTCLSCGHSYYAGEYHKEVRRQEAKKQELSGAVGAMAASFGAGLFMFLLWLIFKWIFFGILSIILACVFFVALIVKLGTPKQPAKKNTASRGRSNR